MAYPKKLFLGQMDHLGPRIAVRIVLQVCTMKGAKRGIGIMVILREILFRAILSFWNKNWMVPS